MKKKQLIVLIVLLSVILAFTGISLLGNRESREMTETIRLVPVDANLIIEVRDFSRLTEIVENPPAYWAGMLSFPSINELNSRVLLLDSLSSINQDLSSIVSNGSLIVSVHDIGKSKLGSILFFPMPENLKSETLLKSLDELWSESAKLKTREYENLNIFDVTTNENQRYAYCIVGRHLVFSSSSLLVEDVIRQSGIETSLLDDKDFQAVYRTAGEKELLNLYFNLNRLSHFLSPFIRESVLDKHKSLSDYASWLALDLSLKESVVSLNGFAILQDSTLSYLDHIRGQDEQSAGFEEILPEGTALFYTQSISNVGKFKKCRKDFLSENHYPGYFETKNNAYKEKVHGDVAELIYGLTESQVCFAISNINQLDINQNAYLIINTRSKSNTREAIEDFIKDYCRFTSQTFDDYHETISPGGNKEYEIYTFPVGDWPALLFGSFYSSVDASACVLIDNYLVFGRDKSSLMRFINAVLLNKTLAKSPVYQDFKKNLSKESQSNFYVNISKSLAWLFSNLDEKNRVNLSKHEDVLRYFSEFAIQQIVSDEMVYHNIALQYRPYQAEAPHTVWESRLDTAVRMKPIIVRNHRTQEKEIFVQDENHDVYLISKDGIVLWKLPLDEEILGEVYQVDAFKNKKLQYLFNTRSKIYLIDRNGNHVERFPVNLRSPASCGLGLFDYDNNRNYRLCVPSEDKKLYMYNIEGNLVDGWEFQGSEYPLSVAPQHIRNGRKDYIVLHDKYKIYILDRKGESRVQPKINFSASKQNKFWHVFSEDESDASITTTNNKGVVYHTYLNGDVDTVFFHLFGQDHFFMYRDLDGDGKEDYIFLDGNMLEVFDHSRKPMMQYKFDHKITEEPTYYVFSSGNYKLGILDKEASLIYLINSGGQLHPGFPLMGTSSFSITYLEDASGHFNLFVGGKGKFLYNYEVK